MLLVAVLVLLLLGGAAPASAHAGLSGTDPRDGSVLDSAPRQLTLTFTESVGLLDDSVRVIDPKNRPVDTGEAAHAGDSADTVRVSLPADLPDGTYTVAWRVVSADSHPVSGAFIFSVGEPSATTAAVTAPTEDPATASLYNIARYAAYGGLALLIGVAVFMSAVLRGPTDALRKLLPAAWLTLVTSTAALLLLRGPYERGTGLTDALDPTVLSATLTTRPGLALLARLALLTAAFFLVRRSDRRTTHPAPGVALSVALAVTWAASEHASAGIQVPVAMTSAVLHLLAMAVWLGGLTALLTVLYRAPHDLTLATVTRFSRLASASVIVLTVTGVYQSWRGLGSWEALTGTTYGRILLAKLAAVALLLAAAAFSRRWTRRWAAGEPARVAAEARVLETVGGSAETAEAPEAPAHDRPPVDHDGHDHHRRALRRSVFAEFMTGVLVLVITTLLTITLPGRAATESAAAQTTAADAGGSTASSSVVPFDVGTPNGQGKVQLDLAPGRVGQNQVQAVVFGPDGGIVTVPELRLTFTLRAQDVGPIDAELENRGGYWGTDKLRLPLPGTWTMKITVRTTDIDQVTVEKDVRVG
ncbi:transport integral membrane protein [Streptomyces spinoverrucosus]|uniref:Protein YobA n=1 Tax=Streptomyces spinoverrucosus TaxID=284043 RepID=A0A4Y3VUC4_9ACTN|nr:transport integral membrane protein [Streptomyces spinoverrucosus]GHB87889.1 transport integral membrane protein [Streptomyces spinoverrucosus]